jgi:cytochrome c-type biogenesis protein
VHLFGNPLDFLFVFMGGVVLSFTPCVYPLIPVTISAIGITAGGSRRRGFLLSLLYVTGIAVTYAALGLAAALTGKMFGRISAHPATHIAVGAVFLLFGLSMFKVFAVYFPSIVSLQRPGKKNSFSILMLGVMSGLIASPCTSPALGAILIYIGATHNVLYGTTLLVAFAYGIGLTLIIAGTFSAMLLSLPKSGRWMLWVERVSASIMVAIGLYFVYEGITRIFVI